MNRVHRAVVGLTLLALATGWWIACGRKPSPERDMMKRLAGRWVWRQAKAAQPMVIVLELTAKGRYKQTTYREIGGQRKLVYVKRMTAEVVPEPEGAEAIAKMKKSGFEPARETGDFRISIGEKTQTIIFENDKVTRIERREGRGIQEQPLVIQTADRIVIAGQTYQREG